MRIKIYPHIHYMWIKNYPHIHYMRITTSFTQLIGSYLRTDHLDWKTHLSSSPLKDLVEVPESNWRSPSSKIKGGGA